MPEIGQNISHYLITEKLGAGGMGEVYRAEDSQLGRQVAIKVLPEMFSGEPERLARFEREAKLLASLNHPNIATIYGLEEAGGVRALVMELLEGPTLAERIARGPVLMDEALPLARQLAEALEYAHERGIVHRDLKPANIKITTEGALKVLDFGLAKAIQGETVQADASKSPTLTDQMTRAGVILGTAAYMSPEEARGSVVDKRADIWAFGAVLFEMLTGKQCFSGESVTDVLAAAGKSEPDWTALPGDTSRSVRDLLHRRLAKDRKQRLHDIADVRLDIEAALHAPAEPEGGTGPVFPTAPLMRLWPLRRALALAAVTLLIGVAATVALVWRLRSSQMTTGTEIARLDMPVSPAKEVNMESPEYGPQAENCSA